MNLKQAKELPIYLTLKEVATLLKVKPRTIYAWTSSYVFPSPRTGERLVEIKYLFVRAIKDAKITDLRFHDLRHTAATRMRDAGADAFTLAAISGWSDIRMAMRYTHAMEDAKRRAVEAIARTSRADDQSSDAVTKRRQVAALQSAPDRKNRKEDYSKLATNPHNWYPKN